MAFSSGSEELVYDTQTTVINETSTIAASAFSTNVTALTSNAPVANGVLRVRFNTTAPTAGDQVKLFRRDLNIDSTSDAPVPDAAYPFTYVGSFFVDAVADADQYLALTDIPLSKDCEFYIQNKTGQTIQSTTTATTLKLTPKSRNVVA